MMGLSICNYTNVDNEAAGAAVINAVSGRTE